MKILQTSVDQLSGVDVQAESLQERFYDRGHGSDLMEHWFDQDFALYSGDEGRTEYDTLQAALDNLGLDYDIVHFHSQSFHWEERNAIVDRFSDSAVVYTAHSAVDDSADDWYKEHQYKYMRDADIVTTVSSYAKQRLMEQQAEHLDDPDRDMAREDLERKLHIVPNGTDFDKYVGDDEVASKAEYLRDDWIRQISPDARRMILFAGRHSPEKGLTDLARAFNHLGGDNGSIIDRKYHDAVLVYAGANGKSNGPDEGMMFDVASALDSNLRDRVRFTGRVNRDELAALYKAADVFVTPTSKEYGNETFNMTIPEASMMGTPVVTSDHAAPAELFVDPGYAVGVEPSNPASIAQGIHHVFSNPDESTRRAEAAKQHALDQYTMESVTRQWIDGIYTRLIDGEESRTSPSIRVENLPGSELHDSPF